MFFPEIYKKPVLTGIVEAAQNGWNAVCEGGGSATSAKICTTGGAPTGSGFCQSAGSSPGKTGDVYYRSGDSDRLFNIDDISEGL